MNKKRRIVRIAASIAAAIAIWLYVDTVRMPSVPMTVKGIPVEFSGESTTLAERGLMLLSGYDATIDLTLKGPRRQLYKMNKDDIRIVVDTSSVTEAGTQSLSYQVIYPDGVVKNSISVDWASAYGITVTVGELFSKEVPIRCEVTGTPKKDFYAEDPILDTQTILLRGQRDDLVNISYAKMTVDISNMDETFENADGFTLYDYNDIAVENNAIRPSVKLVQFKVPVKTTKEVPLEIVVKESAGSTLAQTSYTINPQTVKIAGEKDVLDTITGITLDTVYLQDISESQTLYYEIIAPENTELVGETESATVLFTVVGVTEKTVTLNKFLVERVKEGFTGICTTASIQVTIRGLATEIDAVTAEQIIAVVDFGNLKSAGEYTLPVKIVVNGFENISAKGNYQVNVRLDPSENNNNEGVTDDTNSNG